MKPLSVLVIVTTAACALATPALAQDTGRTSGSYAREASFLYSILRDVGETGRYGMLVDFGAGLTPSLSVIGEFAVHRIGAVDETYAQGAAGIRWSRTGPKARLFVQFAAGPQRSWGSTGYVLQPGVGVNVKSGSRIDTRLQVDVPILRWDGETYRQLRVSVGLGLPFGR